MRRVETELRGANDGVCFVVRTGDPDLRAVLPELAYVASADGFTRCFASSVADVQRIYHHFDQKIEELLEQTARRRPAPWRGALEELAARLERAGADWFLCGSAALAARRIDVEPRDVDVVVSDHAAAMEALDDALIEPPSRDRHHAWVAEWFGRAWLGARVEWVAGVYQEVDDGASPNEIGPSASSRLERVDWNGRTLLLTPLDIQLAVSENRDLSARSQAIRRHTLA